MKKILITGASGFVGTYLAELLLQDTQVEIYGTYLIKESFVQSPIKDKIYFIYLDLEKKEEVQKAVESIMPDEIYHLAAIASVGMSFSDPAKIMQANIGAEINLLESLRVLGLTKTRVIIASSAEVYGNVQAADLPISEATPLRPASPYAVSKIAQDFLGYQYFLSYGIPIIRVRPFNHLGPRQAPGFVVVDFAKQIAAIEKRKQPASIKVGNLEAKRDFTDVRDMVNAYKLVMEKGEAGEVYNIGSGTSHKIREILDSLISFSTVVISIETDPGKMRPSDTPEIVADAKKFTTLTQWKPTISLDQTLRDTLDYWRAIE